MRTDDRRQRSEDGGQRNWKWEVGMRKSENRGGRKADDRSQRTDEGGHTEDEKVRRWEVKKLRG